jgi:hypothetical protein
VSESTVDNAQAQTVLRSGAVGFRREAERARLREDFDTLMATLHEAEQSLRTGRLSTGDVGGAPGAARGVAEHPGARRRIVPRRGGVELADGAAPAPASRAAARKSSAGPPGPGVAEASREASSAAERWNDRLDQRRRDAERHAAALEEVQRRLSCAMRTLADGPHEPAELAVAAARDHGVSAVGEALAERVRLDRNILEIIAGARAALQQACDELACRSHRTHAAEPAEGDQRLRRDSLERLLVALEQDNARLRAERLIATVSAARIGHHDGAAEADA